MEKIKNFFKINMTFEEFVEMSLLMFSPFGLVILFCLLIGGDELKNERQEFLKVLWEYFKIIIYILMVLLFFNLILIH